MRPGAKGAIDQAHGLFKARGVKPAAAGQGPEVLADTDHRAAVQYMQIHMTGACGVVFFIDLDNTGQGNTVAPQNGGDLGKKFVCLAPLCRFDIAQHPRPSCMCPIRHTRCGDLMKAPT